jgi:hypothetical protein
MALSVENSTGAKMGENFSNWVRNNELDATPPEKITRKP